MKPFYGQNIQAHISTTTTWSGLLRSFHSPGVLLAMFAPIGYGPGPPWFIIPCMLFMPGPYGEPAPIMPWDMLG